MISRFFFSFKLSFLTLFEISKVVIFTILKETQEVEDSQTFSTVELEQRSASQKVHDQEYSGKSTQKANTVGVSSNVESSVEFSLKEVEPLKAVRNQDKIPILASQSVAQRFSGLIAEGGDKLEVRSHFSIFYLNI